MKLFFPFALIQAVPAPAETDLQQQVLDFILRYGLWGILGAAIVYVAYKLLVAYGTGAATELGKQHVRPKPEPPPPDLAPPASTPQPEPPNRRGPAPKPPTPDLVHPYPLQPNFTGRVAERKMLTEWFASGSRPVCVVEAIGGMGKSALSWYWLHADVLGKPPPGYTKADPAELVVPEEQRPEGVLFWSFYESDAHFGAFLRRAVEYVGEGAVLPEGTSDRELLERLLDALVRRRILLVLDGFERELRAYAGYRAPYQGDETQQDGSNDCCDPRAAIFLQHAASLKLAGRLLITSRLMPNELLELAGCRHERLDSLAREDVVSFFAACGVKGTRAEIEQAVAPYGGHPLSVSLLARAIVKDRKMRGDIKAAGRHTALGKLKGRAGHDILEVAYNQMTEGRRKLLGRIAAFRSPMDYEAIQAVGAPGLKLDDAIDELEERGLLLREGDRYDLHPIVRQYAYDRLSDKAGVHGRLQDYFDALPAPERVERVEDLTPTIELYWHMVGAGRFDAAVELYHDRLDPLYYRFGAYERVIELLRALFPEGEEGPPRLSEESDQAWTLNELANAYSLAGQPARAVPLFEMQIAIREKQDAKKNLAIGLGNLADDQSKLGRIEAAEAGLRRRIELCREIEDAFNEAIGHRELGRLLAYRGRFAEAERELETALESFQEPSYQQSQGLAHAYRALLALLQREPQAALETARDSRRLADIKSNERDIIRAEWLLGWATSSLGDRAEAERHLNEALTRCRRINMVDHEPSILLALARHHRDRKLALEALRIADRCGYRLNQADIHNLLARLALDAGDPAEAREHAQKAKDYAYWDGPPHHYKPAYEEAQRLLAEAGHE